MPKKKREERRRVPDLGPKDDWGETDVPEEEDVEKAHPPTFPEEPTFDPYKGMPELRMKKRKYRTLLSI